MPTINFSIDFIGIGAQKCGTSWATKVLKEHPEIQINKKEYLFFSTIGEYKNEKNNFNKGISWYRSQFINDSRKKGEISTHYIFDPLAAGRIKYYFPNIKLLVFLREPIKRTYSQYIKERFQFNKENRDLRDIIIQEPHNEIITRSLYYEQLKYFFEKFERENIKIILMDDIANRPKETAKELFDFLGVDSSFTPSNLSRKVNRSSKRKFPFILKLFRRLRYLLSTFKIFEYLESKNVVSYVKRVEKRINEESFSYPDIDKTTKEMLREIYYPDIENLEKLIKKDLSIWK